MLLQLGISVHGKQEAEPDVAANAPNAQAEHATVPVVSALYRPALQAVHATVPVVRALNEPMEHAVHCDAPVRSL